MLLLLLLSHFSRVRLCATPETAAHQAPPSLGFSRQEHWSGLPFPSPMHESEKWKRGYSSHKKASLSILFIITWIKRERRLFPRRRGESWVFLVAKKVVKNPPAKTEETWVWSLVQEDPTCRRATNKPMGHSYWACALEPREPQLLKPTPCDERSPRNE